MNLLFIIDSEVTRRAVKPVLDLFIKDGNHCALLKNLYSVKYLTHYENFFIEESAAINFNYNFIISSNPIQKDKFKGIRISIAHGSMFGNNSWTLNRAMHSDIYFGISPDELLYLKHYLKNSFDERNFIAAGNPANDYLIKFSNLSSSLRKEKRILLGLDDKKTILLSSHWTSIGNLRKFGTGLLDAITWNFPEYQVICTYHPNIITSPKAEYRVNQVVNTPYFDASWLIDSLMSRQNSNIKIIGSEIPPAELLFISDIFIGDCSSLVVEASYFGMPLIINNAGGGFSNTISKIISSDTNQFNNIEELIGILKYIDNKSSVIKVGSKINKIFLYNVGSSAKTIFDSIKYKN
jgi:UDP-N-acetylglucosamine 2-epimerase